MLEPAQKGSRVYQLVENMKSDKALFFYRGSVALYALLRAMEIEPGDEVILQSFTCDIVPATIVRAGGTPVYVDIDPTTFNMNPDEMEERITKKTRAIIVQHTYGIPAEMDSIIDIAQEHDLGVIEDSCHAWGSAYGGREVGTFGDAAFYSFGWHKPFVLGVGGSAIVNDPVLLQKTEEVYDSFITPSCKKAIKLYLQYLAYVWFLNPSRFWSARAVYREFSHRGLRGLVGSPPPRSRTATSTEGKPGGGMGPYGRRMIPFQKRRLYRKLKGFDRAVAHKRWVASQYERLLPQIGYQPLNLDSRFDPVFYKYPLLSDRKGEIFEQAPQARIELSYLFSSPVDSRKPRFAARWRALGYRKGMCPVAEDIADRVVALPVHSNVRPKDLEKMVDFLGSFR